MDERPPWWAEILGASLVVCIFAALTLTATNSWSQMHEMLNSPGGGALLGAVVALIVTKLEGRRARTAQEADQLRRIELVAMGIFQMRVAVTTTLCWLDQDAPYQELLTPIEDEADVLKSIPLIDIPEWWAANELRKALKSYRLFLENWEEGDAPLREPSLDEQALEYLIDALLQCEVEISQRVRDRRSTVFQLTSDADEYVVQFAQRTVRDLR